MTSVAALVLILLVVALMESYRRCTQNVKDRNQRLIELAGAAAPRGRLDTPLPAPVARYLQFALGQHPEPARLMHLAQHGSLRTDAANRRWLDFTADHTVAPLAQAFVWDAKVRMAPGVHLRVIDSLLDGIGAGQVHAMSAVEVARAVDKAEVNSGCLHRFLAEAVWFPWALIPSEHLDWTAIDEHRALATLSAGGQSVSLEFRFAPSGEVTSVFTPARWGRFGERYSQAPWEGQFREYRAFNGLMLPSEGAVGWHRDGELQLVWTGWIDAVLAE
jgi:hypothetical protein